MFTHSSSLTDWCPTECTCMSTTRHPYSSRKTSEKKTISTDRRTNGSLQQRLNHPLNVHPLQTPLDASRPQACHRQHTRQTKIGPRSMNGSIPDLVHLSSLQTEHKRSVGRGICDQSCAARILDFFFSKNSKKV